MDSAHRDTVQKLFEHPASSNIEWREVTSLLAAVGTVSHHQNGKTSVTLGPETEVFTPPHGKDIDAQMAVDLRRMLRGAGLAPGDTRDHADERTRDHGDSQRGEPQS